MAKKRKPAYLKILEGMNACYGGERDCSRCPYDKYNERDFYDMGTSYCMEKLNEDAKKWVESMSMFTNCENCVCWRKNVDEESNVHEEWEGKFGLCSIWSTTMGYDEFCSRGAMKGN